MYVTMHQSVSALSYPRVLVARVQIHDSGGGGGRPFPGRAGSAVEREAMSGMNTFTQYDNSMAEFWKQCVPGVPGTSLPG